jgi:hypothetical protein
MSLCKGPTGPELVVRGCMLPSSWRVQARDGDVASFPLERLRPGNFHEIAIL